MESEAWLDALNHHDVFKTITADTSSTTALGASLLQIDDLRTNTSLVLHSETGSDVDEESTVQRSNIMCIRGPDLFLAVGRQIRMLPLKDVKESERAEDVPYKVSSSSRASFVIAHVSQTLSTPNVTFDIKQMIVNPTGKLLAVVGARQIAVVVLPRPGISKISSTRLECRYVHLHIYFVASLCRQFD